MSEGHVRTIKINSTGTVNNIEEVTEDIVDPPVVNRRRRTNRRKQEGGSASENPVINITKDNSTIPVVPPKLPSLTGGSKTNIPPGPRLNSGSVQVPSTPIIDIKDQVGSVAGDQKGGLTKVVLKRKNRTSKVILKTKTTAPEVPTGKVQGSGSLKKKTRRLIVKQVSKRLKKTRHLVKHAKEMPIDALRKILVTKKLIKPNSKAPESILRQIYADSVIVGKKTL